MSRVELSRQCESIGWPIRFETLAEDGLGRPEEHILSKHLGQGFRGTWCEGASVKLLMKAAALPFLIENRLWYQTPEIVVSGYFEAFCKTLIERRRELISTIQRASVRDVQQAIFALCSDPSACRNFPRVRLQFLVDLWEATGPLFISRIAEVFTSDPYRYRAGWPDLTLLGSSGLCFVEVKTTDLLLPSQLRFAHELANPLGFRCEVVVLEREVPNGGFSSYPKRGP